MIILVYAFASLFSANSFAISMMTLLAFSMLSTEIYSNLPWKFSPPVKMLGVGSPMYESWEPSVPPRIGSIIGSMSKLSLPRLQYQRPLLLAQFFRAFVVLIIHFKNDLISPYLAFISSTKPFSVAFLSSNFSLS